MDTLSAASLWQFWIRWALHSSIWETAACCFSNLYCKRDCFSICQVGFKPLNVQTRWDFFVAFYRNVSCYNAYYAFINFHTPVGSVYIRFDEVILETSCLLLMSDCFSLRPSSRIIWPTPLLPTKNVWAQVWNQMNIKKSWSDWIFHFIGTVSDGHSLICRLQRF